jgi:hypothetical protein
VAESAARGNPAFILLPQENEATLKKFQKHSIINCTLKRDARLLWRESVKNPEGENNMVKLRELAEANKAEGQVILSRTPTELTDDIEASIFENKNPVKVADKVA